MKLKDRRQSGNVGKQGSPYAKAKEPFMEISPHEGALIKPESQASRVFAGSSMERLRKTKLAKQREGDLSRISKDVSEKMEGAAQRDKLGNVMDAIKKAKGSIPGLNPFQKARGK